MRTRHVAIGLLVIAAAAGGWLYYANAQRHPATADAYLGMHIIRVASQVDGPVTEVRVRNNQAVRAGDLLFAIDPTPFALAVQQGEARLQQARDALAAAEARVQVAKAQLEAAQATFREAERHANRILDLAAVGSVSKDEGDAAERARLDGRDNLIAARAQLAAAEAERGATGNANAAIKAAEAALGQARLDLQHTRVWAPANGIVGDVALRPGSFVTAGRALFALVETSEVWVDANVKETDLARIRPGQPARVTVDLLPGKTFHGEVESLSPASGAAFSLLPPENATGNWVKVTQRFPVRVRILDPVPRLRVGASCHVTIDTAVQSK